MDPNLTFQDVLVVGGAKMAQPPTSPMVPILSATVLSSWGHCSILVATAGSMVRCVGFNMSFGWLVHQTLQINYRSFGVCEIWFGEIWLNFGLAWGTL